MNRVKPKVLDLSLLRPARRRKSLLKKTSDLEESFVTLWRLHGRPEQPCREHRFHSERRWRFDFAWPCSKVAVELDGGAWRRGRHHRPQGFREDCRKHNAASLAGWTVLRYTAEDLRERPLQMVEEVVCVLAGKEAQ
jgi:very-short-patch-repair endonuclease